MTPILSKIARQHLRLETLETRNSDSLDFSDQAVWNIKAALEHAYSAGGMVRVKFARKPNDMHEVLAAARDEDDKGHLVRIIEHRRLTPTEYEALSSDFMGIYEWMRDKGGWDRDGNRLAIKITCPGYPTLFIDPSGAFYGRYVGVEV